MEQHSARSIRPRLQYLVALIAGGLTTLTASPFNWWWLAPIVIGLMYWGTHRLSTGQAVIKGWWYGLGLFGTGTSWVYVSIHDYGYTGAPLAIFLTALFAMAMALFPAITLGLYRGLVVRAWPPGALFFRGSLITALAFAGAWVLGEALRTYLFTGFPWLLIGTSMVDAPLSPWAPVLGVYGLSLITALTGTLGVELLRRRWLAGLPIAILWLAPLTLPQHWTEPSGDPVRVALLQGNLPQLIKWTEQGQRQAVNTYSALTQAQNADIDLVLWPEAALPMFEDQARPFLERILANLSPDTALLTGILQRDDAGNAYNGVIGVGNTRGHYRKEHLVPFGEYLPLEGLLGGLIAFFDLPTPTMTPERSKQPPMQAAGLEIGTAICYEIVYPDLVANRARDANVLLTVSNDTWFGDSFGPLQHVQMARLRALENGRYLLRATSNGVTVIIDPKGEITAQAERFTTTSIEGDVQAMQGLTPFTHTGSWPVWLMSLLLLAPALVGVGSRKQRQSVNS